MGRLHGPCWKRDLIGQNPTARNVWVVVMVEFKHIAQYQRTAQVASRPMHQLKKGLVLEVGDFAHTVQFLPQILSIVLVTSGIGISNEGHQGTGERNAINPYMTGSSLGTIVIRRPHILKLPAKEARRHEEELPSIKNMKCRYAYSSTKPTRSSKMHASGNQPTFTRLDYTYRATKIIMGCFYYDNEVGTTFYEVCSCLTILPPKLAASKGRWRQQQQ